jgi:hypothetical protein
MLVKSQYRPYPDHSEDQIRKNNAALTRSGLLRPHPIRV